MDKAYIYENQGAQEGYSSFEIRVPCGAEGEKDPTIVRCWDVLLAEYLCKAVNEYLKGEYKIVSGEDADCG
jgi:hypothetical protein